MGLCWRTANEQTKVTICSTRLLHATLQEALSIRQFVGPLVRWSFGPSVHQHKLKSGKTHISAPAHLSATGSRVSGLVSRFFIHGWTNKRWLIKCFCFNWGIVIIMSGQINLSTIFHLFFFPWIILSVFLRNMIRNFDNLLSSQIQMNPALTDPPPTEFHL